MVNPSASGSAFRNQMSADRVSRLAAQQGGRITTAQLRRCGLSKSRIVRWQNNGRLHRVCEGLYAVGHTGRTDNTPLHEALLIAGEGAALSHITAAWWWGLLRFAGRVIHVSAPGARRSRQGIHVHHPAEVRREWHRGLPVTPVSQALLEIGPMVSFAGVRRALAITDKRGLMTVPALEELARSGAAGCVPIREALAVHMPQLANTRSPLEDRFLFLCERYGIELPIPNYEVAGLEVDAVWPDLRLAVELDGREEHGTPAAVVTDRRRELTIRRAGYELIRYGSEQIDHHAQATAADLRAAMAGRRV